MNRFSFVLIGFISFFSGWAYSQTSLRPPLLATEEEVRQFFTVYVDRYNRKETEAFLSLFSPKAMQNKRDDWEQIQRIYAQFFNQSESLRLQLEPLRQEIYENGVEVKARYLIHQTPKGGGKGREWVGQVRWVLVKEDGKLRILSLEYQHERVP